MKFIRVLKASEDWKVEKISETDWVIKSPDGAYKNSNGKDYHFKTKEDALEELDYLRAEHKFDKKSSSEDEELEIASDIIHKINLLNDHELKDLENYLDKGDKEAVRDLVFTLSEKLNKIISLANKFNKED